MDAEITEVLAEQAAYYRARATEYDQDVLRMRLDPALSSRVAAGDRWFDDLPIQGKVLEVACGTGSWTGRLADRAGEVHAFDAVPEMIELARSKLAGRTNVSFEVADILERGPSATYDTVFMSFLLSHVPRSLIDGFWDRLTGAVADGGILAIIDAAPGRAGEEEWVGPEIAARRLRDGSRYRIVKVAYEPEEVAVALARRGFEVGVDIVAEEFLTVLARRDH